MSWWRVRCNETTIGSEPSSNTRSVKSSVWADRGPMGLLAWAIPFTGPFGLEEPVPGLSGPISRDFSALMSSDRGPAFFHGA
jgi:hypothetical protein